MSFLNQIKEPGRLIISLALLAISLPLIVVGEISVAVLIIAAVAGAWGVKLVANNKKE